MANKELFHEWQKYAEEDLQIADIALAAGGPANQICFHCQQAAEKCLKGFLALNGKRFEKSHQLDYLLYLCQSLDKSFSELEEPVKYLTDFYLETRYPGDIPEFSLKQAKQARQFAQAVNDFIIKKMPQN